MRGPVDVRFEQFVVRQNGCWPWRGSISPEGYARLRIGDQPIYAHRISYELFVGQIPAGLDIDHLCRNRGCVNPAHLEPVTRKENLRRGRAFKQQRQSA